MTTRQPFSLDGVKEDIRALASSIDMDDLPIKPTASLTDSEVKEYFDLNDVGLAKVRAIEVFDASGIPHDEIVDRVYAWLAYYALDLSVIKGIRDEEFRRCFNDSEDNILNLVRAVSAFATQ